jgi:GNAT superfamily N-acetyltransferase
MEVDYRPMRADEEGAILQLWSAVFDVPYAQEAWRFASDRDRFATTFVAVDDHDGLLAAAHFRIERRRDEASAPQRVGQLDPVATHPAFQRQGHASRLINLVIEAMERAGCAWSVLLASDVGRALYERLGWRSLPIRYRRGAIAAAHPRTPETLRVDRLDPRRGEVVWEQLAAVYDTAMAARPFTVVRDADYWRQYAAPRILQRLEAERLEILVATDASKESGYSGYAFAQFFDVGLLVSELAVDPRSPRSALALLMAAGDEACRRGLAYGEVDAPRDPSTDGAVAALFGPTLHLSEPNTRLMARPLTPAWSHQRLAALLAAPGAVYWSIDHF